ncbi:hypothetical protein MMB17_17715 [Methylobacterium organophilum]|uniref:hypothetical protein n=1 Tax=Methylobacterium organophilum TaxID=410 RepID=UPI001F12FE1A|nr:hypothetical protein [Methylobacterium organophilum]UMY16517.1 hypothetical protein MMB17_17715 [Methylobacterium organophilum]
MSTKLDLTHRDHRIIAAVLRGRAAAQVYRGDRLATRERFESASVEGAADAARAWIDRQNDPAEAQRRAPEVGTADEYVAHFARNPPEGRLRRMLVAHAAAPERILSSDALAEAGGWNSVCAAHAHYAAFGETLAEVLSLTLPRREDGAPVRISAVASAIQEGPPLPSGACHWRLHEEIAQALERLNIAQRPAPT